MLRCRSETTKWKKACSSNVETGSNFAEEKKSTRVVEGAKNRGSPCYVVDAEERRSRRKLVLLQGCMIDDISRIFYTELSIVNEETNEKGLHIENMDYLNTKQDEIALSSSFSKSPEESNTEYIIISLERNF